MWWFVFAATNWLGVAYLKERWRLDVLKPTPLENLSKMSPANLLILVMYGAGLYGVFKIGLKWIKKKV